MSKLRNRSPFEQGDVPPRAKPSSYPEPFLTRMAKREKRQLGDVFGCLLPALSSDLPRLDRAARERFALGVERLTGAIEALVAALGHAGAGEVASSTLAEMVGAISLARGIPDLRRSNALLKRSRELLKARLGVTEKS
jgi:TetR/AcrR family transcriptional regulator, transcriptional repressor for nem operon